MITEQNIKKEKGKGHDAALRNDLAERKAKLEGDGYSFSHVDGLGWEAGIGEQAFGHYERLEELLDLLDGMTVQSPATPLGDGTEVEFEFKDKMVRGVIVDRTVNFGKELIDYTVEFENNGQKVKVYKVPGEVKVVQAEAEAAEPIEPETAAPADAKSLEERAVEILVQDYFSADEIESVRALEINAAKKALTKKAVGDLREGGTSEYFYATSKVGPHNTVIGFWFGSRVSATSDATITVARIASLVVEKQREAAPAGDELTGMEKIAKDSLEALGWTFSKVPGGWRTEKAGFYPDLQGTLADAVRWAKNKEADLQEEKPVGTEEAEPVAPDWIIGEDNICPVRKVACDDECCPPGATCNMAPAADGKTLKNESETEEPALAGQMTFDEIERVQSFLTNGWAIRKRDSGAYWAQKTINGKPVTIEETDFDDFLCRMEEFDPPKVTPPAETLPTSEIKKCRFELTDEDVKLKTNALLETMTVIDTKKAALADIKKEYKKALEKLESEQEELRRQIQSRVEYRPIECDIEYDLNRGEKIFYRPDTQEQVDRVSMSRDELRIALANQNQANLIHGQKDLF